MKRTFLFGLGSSLILSAIGMLGEAVANNSILPFVVGLICVPLGVAAIRGPPSEPRAIRPFSSFGWLHCLSVSSLQFPWWIG
jgi:hypothetical protein